MYFQKVCFIFISYISNICDIRTGICLIVVYFSSTNKSLYCGISFKLIPTEYASLKKNKLRIIENQNKAFTKNEETNEKFARILK